MGALIVLLCALFVFIRSGIALRLTARFRPGAVMGYVSSRQRSVSRRLFLFARWFGGLRLRFEGYEGPDLPPVFLLVSNHQSLVDIPALTVAFSRHPLRFVAKKELSRGIPYISIILRIGGHAIISRTGDYRKGHEELRRFAELARQGICPVVFPEGTRSRTGRVGGFYAGAVRIILERARIPVLSVAVDGGYRMSTVPGLLRNLRGTFYRVKPLTLYRAPNGKREILEVLAKIETEIAVQIGAWRDEEEKKPIPSGWVESRPSQAL